MRIATTAAVFAVCSMTTAALAGDPDPKEIVAAVDKAAKAVNAVSYDAKAWGEGVLEGKLPRLEARVQARADKKGDLDAFRIEGVMPGEEKTSFVTVMNRGDILVLDPKLEAATAGELPDAEELIKQPMGLLLMREFVYPTPYSDELGADSLEYKGKHEIGGIQCHVIYVVYEGKKAVARWYFGVDDNLPRRVDRIHETPQGEGVQVLEISNLNTTPTIAAAAFDTKPPQGFEIKRYASTADKPKPAPKPKPKRRTGLLEVGSEAPDWTLTTSRGDKVTLSKLRGKVVVLDFWATWCGPCKKAMPSVQKLHEHFKGKPVAVFGVDVWESAKGDPAGYMKEKGFTYTLLMKGDELAKSYQFNGIPTFYVIGADGCVLHASTGFRPEAEAELTKLIEEALE